MKKNHNNFWTRVLCIAFGTVFTPVKQGHLTHHRYSRYKEERVEVYKGKKTILFSFVYYFILLGGLYLSELILPMIVFLPKKILIKIKKRLVHTDTIAEKVFINFINDKEKIRKTKVDATFVLIYLLISYICYHEHYSLFFLFYILRAFFISFFDYTYHYATKLDDNSYAKNLYLPRVFAFLFLNFNLHGDHHISPLVPWYLLNTKTYQGNFLSESLKQLQGPISQESLQNE